MSGKVTIDTREVDRIAERLGASRGGIINRIAFEVEADAKMRAPFEFGALRNSLHTDPASPKNPVAVVSDAVNYGVYQEYGTSRMPAQPFLGPAAENIANRYNTGAAWEGLIK